MIRRCLLLLVLLAATAARAESAIPGAETHGGIDRAVTQAKIIHETTGAYASEAKPQSRAEPYPNQEPSRLLWIPADGWVAIFTALLFGSTVLLWLSTRASVRIAERALTELERPYVFVAVPSVQVDERKVRIDPDVLLALGFKQVRVAFLNYGRSPASLTFLHYDFVPADKGTIPPPIDPTRTRGRELPVGVVTDRDKPHCEDSNLFARFDLDTQFAFGGDTKSLWLIGFVRYRDIFGGGHINGFCMVYDHIGGAFVRRGNEKYNYARPEKQRDIPAAQKSA